MILEGSLCAFVLHTISSLWKGSKSPDRESLSCLRSGGRRGRVLISFASLLPQKPLAWRERESSCVSSTQLRDSEQGMIPYLRNELTDLLVRICHF